MCINSSLHPSSIKDFNSSLSLSLWIVFTVTHNDSVMQPNKSHKFVNNLLFVNQYFILVNGFFFLLSSLILSASIFDVPYIHSQFLPQILEFSLIYDVDYFTTFIHFCLFFCVVYFPKVYAICYYSSTF